MNPEPFPPPPRRPTPTPEPSPNPPYQPRRMFLCEPGWGVTLKVGSERIFCYMMAPGQDFYHRLLDGEIYVFRGDERICLACAMRRGLLSFETNGLGGLPLTFFEGTPAPRPQVSTHEPGFDLAPPPGDDDDL